MRKIFLLSAAVFCIMGAWAQQRTCGTMHHEQLLMQSDPHYSSRRQAIDQFAQNYSMTQHSQAQRTVITIPVVVHVIYSTAAGNISTAQIQSEIDRLNLDYHKSNADTANVPAVWKNLVADCNIQFCLAQRTPTGIATTGIIRKATTVTSWTDDDKVKYSAQGGDDAWPATSYLNLWVCDLGGGLLGYAQFPGGTAATDGVVILNTGFGNTGTAAAPYNLGRTATHEIGHWLNLYHIWGDDNGACTGTDLVNDTPNQGDSNYGCPTFPHTDACATTSPGVMFMNYMDYVDDACMYMFTNGQNTRIQANFATGGSRAALLNSQGCVPISGGPVTAFTANKTTICVGQSINFTDHSTGTPTSWSWQFPGAVTTTSTTQNPQNIVYNTAGTYSVTLTATNSGGSTPLTQTNYITVLGTTALPLREGFEATTFPPTGWTLGNGDASTTWARTASASGFGQSTACAFMDNYNYSAAGQKDYLYTPVYNFGNHINANSKLKFDYAYARDRSGATDTLQIMVSTDCGVTWTSLWKKGGTTLQTTTTTYNGTFNPTATQWVRDSTISLAAYVGQTSVKFAFVNINDYGNSVLLDNINIDTIVGNAVCTTHPTAAYVASPTTVTAGSTVTFTDQSSNSPTAWAWTFGGGTPATSAVQSPGPITFSTIGTYTAKLKVTNACGSDSITHTITVVAPATASSCDTLTHILSNDTATIYYVDATPADGFISGTNVYGDLSKAVKYTNVNARPISKVLLAFGVAQSAGTTDSVTVNIWDANGSAGLPGTVLGTVKIAMSTIAANVASNTITAATFATPVVTNANFYAGFNINTTAGSTIAVASTKFSGRANHAYQGYEQYINTTTNAPEWGAMDSDWTFPMTFYIFPIQCTQAGPVAAFTANKTSLCAGDSVHFTDQSTGTPTSWSWQVTGPVNLVSAVHNPTFTFTTAGTYSVTLTVSNASGNGSYTQASYITVHAAPSDSTVATTVSCYGGSDGTAAVYATGGTSYTYLWSPGGATTQTISSKPAGAYTVTVTSNFSCSSTASVSITQPFSALTASASFTSAYCGNSNGSVTVAAAGGNGGYTYIWSPGSAATATVSNLAAGTYTVSVLDSKNCLATASATITSQTSPVTINFTNTSPSCNASNGSIVATINGSSNGAHYHWSRGDSTGSITNVAAGIYTVTITNALGCSASKSDTLRSTVGPSVSITSTTPVSCFGGTTGGATALATGGTGTIAYNWSNGAGTAATISGKPAGTYTVTVTDANTCTATASAVITQPASVVSVTATATAVSCFGGANGAAVATATGGTGTLSYNWSNSAGTTPAISGRPAGTYVVTATDTRNCTATASVSITQPSAVSATTNSTSVNCNTSGSTTVTATGGNSGGYTYLWSPGSQTTATVTNLSAGTYSVTVRDTRQCSAVATVAVTDQSATLVVTITKTDATCGSSNGSVTANTTATGVTYTWSPGGSHASSLTNIAAGTYTVTITNANGCSASATTNVQNSNGANITTSSTPVTCFGNTNGTATVSATGGSGTYTYTWSGGGSTNTINNRAAGTYIVTVSDGSTCSATASVVIAGPASALSANVSSTPVNCATTGTASVIATGGNTGGYTYLWSQTNQTTATISNLTAGSYTVTVMDARQCSVTSTVNVADQSTTITASISKTDASCGGSNGTATVTTAATGATYHWSPGGFTSAAITGLSTGTYTVTVSNANGCTASASTTISNTNGPTLSVTSTPAICHGTPTGTATVTSIGGSGTPSYAWSGNAGTNATATGLSAGIYTVTVTSGTCTGTASVAVTEPTAVFVATTSSPVICSTMGTATATGSGGSGTNYSYLWNTSATSQTITGLTATTYTVTVKDGNNCTAVASATITTQPSTLSDSVASTSASSATTANGTATAYAVDGTANFTYSWSNGQQTRTATQLLPGTYTCTITDANGCTTVASATVGQGPNGISDLFASLHYSISPNPASDKCNINIEMTETQSVELAIYSLIGQKIWSKDLGHIRTASEVVDIQDLAEGIYIVKIKAGERTYSNRLIKE